MWWLLLAACGPSEALDPVDDGVDTASSQVHLLADAVDAPFGARVRVGPVVVVSPLLRDGTAFYVQELATGEGLEVRAGLRWPGPPAVGEVVELSLLWVGSAVAPSGWLTDEAGLELLGVQAEPVVSPAVTDAGPFALVQWPDVVVLTHATASGRAQLSNGQALDGAFGVAVPPRGNVGTVTGVRLRDGAVAPRTDTDWEGPRVALDGVEATVEEIVAGAHFNGSLVRVQATQAAPWSRDGRWTVLQGVTGDGLWLDAEGWAARWTVARDHGFWTAEVVDDGERIHLRGWTAPEITERRLFAAPPWGLAEGEALPPDGRVVELSYTGLGRPDAWGERTTAEGVVLDDRFVPIDAIGVDGVVRGAMDRRGGRPIFAVSRAVEARPTAR